MASLDGAGPLGVAMRVVWPLAWPTLLAGGILLAALSLTEVPATVLLSPQNPQVLTPMLMTWVHMARFDPMIEASLLMVMLVLTLSRGMSRNRMRMSRIEAIDTPTLPTSPRLI